MREAILRLKDRGDEKAAEDRIKFLVKRPRPPVNRVTVKNVRVCIKNETPVEELDPDQKQELLENLASAVGVQAADGEAGQEVDARAHQEMVTVHRVYGGRLYRLSPQHPPSSGGRANPPSAAGRLRAVARPKGCHFNRNVHFSCVS